MSNARSLLDECLAEAPVVAILRGIKPDEVLDVGRALMAAGVRIIEVPLNSPEPFRSISELAEVCGERCVVGAGTVLSPGDVSAVAEAGGKLVVTPNTDVEVIAASVAAGLVPMPGFMTPTEGLAAIRAGARHLKLFPASSVNASHLPAIRAVLPPAVKVLAVGGVGVDEVGSALKGGFDGVGLGSGLYRPGDAASEVEVRARRAIRSAREGRPG